MRHLTFLMLAALLPAQDLTLSGKHHVVYAAWQRGESGSIFGTIQFDGSGSYSLQGTWRAGTSSRDVNTQGSYRLRPDGIGQMTNPLDPLLPPLSLRLGAGSSSVSGSTLESSSAHHHDLLIALPAGTAARSNADLNGIWSGTHNTYIPGSTPVARAGRFRFNFDGSGSSNSQEWTFHQSDQSNGAAQTLTSAGSYSISPDGSGTWETAQGRKRIAISSSGDVLVGTDDATGRELIFAVRNSGQATGLNGRFYWEQLVAVAPGGTDPRASASSWALTNDLGAIDGAGASRASGSQHFIDGPTGRLLDMAAMLGPFTFSPTGYVDLGFGGLASPGIGAISGGSAPFLTWTNLTSTVTGTYSFNILLPAPVFSKPNDASVWLNPGAVVHEAGQHGSPGPLAPGTLVTIRGAGLASATSKATTLPLPSTLGATQLLANGQPAALYEVAPDYIKFVMPNATAGAGRVELRAVNGGTQSNPVQVRSAPALPAFFSQSGSGLGAILAIHADGTPVNAASPASRGEVITAFATGLGLVTGAPAEGVAATGPAPTTIPVQVDFAGALGEVLYAGLLPGYPGMYQVNVRIPANAATGAAVNVRIQQGYTQSHNKVTVAITQ